MIGNLSISTQQIFEIFGHIYSCVANGTVLTLICQRIHKYVCLTKKELQSKNNYLLFKQYLIPENISSGAGYYKMTAWCFVD